MSNIARIGVPMRRSRTLRLFLISCLVFVAACAKTVTKVNSGLPVAPTSEQLKSLFQSYNRPTNAIFQLWDKDLNAHDMGVRIQKGILNGDCETDRNNVEHLLDGLSGQRCPIQWHGGVKWSERNSQIANGTFDDFYQILAADFLRYNDIDGYRLTGDVHKKIAEHEHGQGMIFKKNLTGFLDSQNFGRIAVEEIDDIATSYMNDPRHPDKWWGHKNVTLTFSSIVYRITMRFDGDDAEFRINGVEITDQEFKTILQQF